MIVTGGHGCRDMRYSIPMTISLEAREAYRRFIEDSAAATASQPVDAPKSAEDWRKRQTDVEKFCRIFEPQVESLRPVVSETVLGGVPALLVRPQVIESSSRILVYIHGGGYTTFS